MATLVDRYANKIRGVLSCFDRVVITGTIPEICHAGAMAAHLTGRNIRLFDYTHFAEPLRDEIRQNAERLAQENGLQIDYIRRKDFRKEERIKAILAKRGNHPGLVHIFSAMEPCASFRPWYDKTSKKTSLKPTQGKCLHYYFYFIDEVLGLCYLRVPTWAPFRLQFYFNGHNELANKLDKVGIGHTLVENAFLDIDDFGKAQKLADTIRPDRFHQRLNRLARHYCPVLRHFRSGIHWSIMQTEYAIDIIFRNQEDLRPLYEALTRTAIHTVKPEDVATFLGRKLSGNYQGEIGTDFHTRIQGTRIKHHMGWAVSIKMYDKLGVVLRIETTANDVTFFRHHRRVEHRDGSWEMKEAPVKKTIYSLPVLRELMGAANRRYLDFISTIEDPTTGTKDLEKISRPARDGERTARGFNLFHGEDLNLFEAIARGEFNISGLTNRRLQRLLTERTGPQLSRSLRQLRLHGLIKKVGHTYKYYLTRLGRKVVLAALKLRRLVVIPSLGEPVMP